MEQAWFMFYSPDIESLPWNRIFNIDRIYLVWSPEEEIYCFFVSLIWFKVLKYGYLIMFTSYVKINIITK